MRAEVNERLLAVPQKEAARLLSITDRTLREWAKTGILKPARIGGKVLYRVADLDAFLISRKGA